MLNLFLLVTLPVLAGIAALFLKGKKERGSLALCVFSVGLAAAVISFFIPPKELLISLIGDYSLMIGPNKLSALILLFINLFGLLTCFYSQDNDQAQATRTYFSYLLWLIAFSNLVALSLDFITFIFAWGATLVLLYAFLNLNSAYSARKAISIVGAADFALMLGIGIYIASTGNIKMPQGFAVVLDSPLLWLSFILMLCGALAKAGSGPFHTWIPLAAESAPASVMAILPSSLDKLLGIYLLARICVDFFVMNNIIMAILLVTGGLTIIFGVMMALVQHDLRKLLAYHAISQVGYMVLGFGTAAGVGIAAGIFHMVNNAIYKSGLFFTGGVVGAKRKTFELEKLGGLAKFMPFTFFAGLVFALSISGIPPLNGFASKWMLYQGVLSGFANAGSLWLRGIFIFALVAAMFGSALTLASFVKFIHAIFLGQDNSDGKKTEEASPNALIPLLALAGLCIVLGVFPKLFLKGFIEPYFSGSVFLPGAWNSLFVFIFMVLGLGAGFIFWANGKFKSAARFDSAFTGCESGKAVFNFPATEFYRTVEELPLINRLYRFLKIEALDIFNILSLVLNITGYVLFVFVDRLIYLLTSACAAVTLGASRLLRLMHTGLLDLYLAWCLLGLAALFFILMFK